MFAYWGILLLRTILGLFPPTFVRRVGAGLGKTAYFIDRKHQKIARENINKALGELELGQQARLAKNSFSFMGQQLFESMLLDKFLTGDWKKLFEIKGREYVNKALQKKKGIIFVLAHLDNWEYLALIPRLLGFDGGAVAQDIKNPALDGLIRDSREKMGLVVFGKHEVSGSILDFLAQGGGVAILADQRARSMQISTPFFGHPAATTVAPALLAARSQATILPIFIHTSDKNFLVEILEPVPAGEGKSLKEKIAGTTEKINLIIEKRIRQYPERWLWAHRRWKPLES